MVFAADGVTPLALTTAAMHGPVVVPGTWAQDRVSFTLVQALQQKANATQATLVKSDDEATAGASKAGWAAIEVF